ncbi:MAG: DEAD/DEAH box helicase, partial [Bifidobacteriaceae bacterium]|nr:DEAD/DEAH box helicase [Bifidobacteriaceae bacterium]
MNRLVAALGEASVRAECVTHVEVTPPRPGAHGAWPEWVPDWVRSGYEVLGVPRPWAHQVEAMERARQGHCVIATATGSGKSLALWTPALAALDEPYELGRVAEVRARASALYLAPTKALAADQLASLRALLTAACAEGLEVTTCDGDTPWELRRWVQSKADVVLTNPDFLHFSLLPGHARWAGFLGGLRYVIVDELHAYRGVMGAHVAWVMRRLRRLARHYGADPIFLAASATVSQPEVTFARLIGEDAAKVAAVCADTAEHGERTFVLWRPASYDGAAADESAEDASAGSPKVKAARHDFAPRPVKASGDAVDDAVHASRRATSKSASVGSGDGSARRRSAAAEASRLLVNLVDVGARTLVFVRSRYSAESVATAARQWLDGAVSNRVATYRGGYLPEERRDLERRLRNGALLGLVSTTALELGIDIAGLDAVVTAGWPGTRIALAQQ